LDAGFPPGVFNVVLGNGPDCGHFLAAHPGVRKVNFTGSVATGRKVHLEGAKRLVDVSLELGGKSSLLVFDDSPELAAVVEQIAYGIFSNCGQVCSATSRLLLQKSISDTVIAALIERTKKVQSGRVA
jgi:betaine-aldehyde dehydrogenase